MKPFFFKKGNNALTWWVRWLSEILWLFWISLMCPSCMILRLRASVFQSWPSISHTASQTNLKNNDDWLFSKMNNYVTSSKNRSRNNCFCWCNLRFPLWNDWWCWLGWPIFPNPPKNYYTFQAWTINWFKNLPSFIIINPFYGIWSTRQFCYYLEWCDIFSRKDVSSFQYFK